MASVAALAEGRVRGFLHRPAAADGRGLILTHGAGGNCMAPLLIAAAEAFSAAGTTVLRCDLPFRQRRPAGPPSPAGAAADRAGLRDAVAALRARVSGPVAIGGLSYGGRQASMLAAEDPGNAAALLLFSYPLHPPGRPDRRRTEHWPRLRLPVLFIHGTRDAFASIEELASAASLIPAATRILPIDGAGHDLRRGRFNLAEVVAAFADLSAVAPGA
jgi:uncharacterized protein